MLPQPDVRCVQAVLDHYVATRLQAIALRRQTNRETHGGLAA
jgi:hypothetical protein